MNQHRQWMPKLSLRFSIIFVLLPENQMVFLISHRFSTVRMADKIVVIEDGEVVEQGTHEELLQTGGRYAKLFLLQAAGYK